MKRHLIHTLSLALLLSTPFALRAFLEGSPHAQQEAYNAQITTLGKTLVTLQQQLTPALQKSKEPKDIKKALDISLAIQAVEAKIAIDKALLPGLASRITKLEPTSTAKDLESVKRVEWFGKYQTSLSGITTWKNFKHCETTKVPSQDNPLIKIDQATVAASDKSDVNMPREFAIRAQEAAQRKIEDEKRKNNSWGAIASRTMSLVGSKVSSTTAPSAEAATTLATIAAAASTTPAATDTDTK